MKNEEINQEGADRLVPLSNSKDFKVAKDNPDVRGWRVVGSDGERLGLVKDLVVDTQEMKVRYLAVTADRRFYNDNYDRYLLVPIGSAALDKSGNKVFISNIDSKTIVDYPTYHGGPITEEYEFAVREALMHPSDRNNTLRRDNDNLRSDTDNLRSDADNTDTYRNDTNTYRSDSDTYRSGAEDIRLDGDTHTGRTDYARNEPTSVTPRRISNDFYNDDNYNESRFYNNIRDDDSDDRSAINRDNTSDYYNNQDNAINDQNNKIDSATTQNSTYKQNVEESISTIERLEQLRERGSITEEEFRVLKKRALDI